ncbi:hypothetical protein C2W62_22400 [Candidatus Entotheonella serta]|nr:hypothetical protein C2W62_22400 [Candidatus Entotheonella serta]
MQGRIKRIVMNKMRWWVLTRCSFYRSVESHMVLEKLQVNRRARRALLDREPKGKGGEKQGRN